MKRIANFFIGILIGCGAILPGVSSGVFCVIFGIYEKLINSISNLFKDLKTNLSFLLPIGFGTFLGIVLFGNIIKYLFSNFEIQSRIAFTGLIIGTIPALFKQVSKTPKNLFSIKKLIPLFIAFFIGIILIILENHISFNFNLIYENGITSYIYLIFAGFIMSIGIIVPGISNTVLLMCLGIYSEYIYAISSINLHILIPMGIGILLGGVIWIQLIKLLLSKYHEKTFLAIIGFTLGSIFVLLPNYDLFLFYVNNISSLFQILLVFIISIFISYKLEKWFCNSYNRINKITL